MCQCKSWVLCAVLCICVYSVSTFNVDSYNYALYQGQNYAGRDPMFGFSMALHREGNRGWLIVGAPEAQAQNQPTVRYGGAVYKCPTDRDGGCEEIAFDTKGDNYEGQHRVDNKTEQWFGATISSSGREEGPIVACAPRYTWFPSGNKRRDPVGTCYVSNGQFSEFNEYSPCRTYQWGYHRQGSCQAGFSAAINSVGDRLFIGSPGSRYWQGQMFSIDAHATFEFKPRLFSATYGHEGQVHQQSLETRPAVFSTTEGTEQDDDSYMGYSTITGDFMETGEEGIAVGMPRGNGLKGKVLLFGWNLTNYVFHFSSDQIGSYYGYALAACDVDGDGRLDLVVGSPMYTVQNNKGEYDVGRVYVIYHQFYGEHKKYEKEDFIDGFNTKSRFGQALASLGDINQDGYGDFAVGAPYDGKDNRGAVYIYHGSSKGVRKKYSQVIFAEDIVPQASKAPTTFGFSITGGLDLDNNQYPDMAVGAYLSSQAFFFRSRPVIKVEASVKYLSNHKTVDITNPNHILSDGSEAVKSQIQFCSNYSGKGIPASLVLGVEYILDTKKLINARMGFVDDESQNRKNTTITLFKGVENKCADPINVYVRSDIRDKLTTLIVEAKYWLKHDADLTPDNLHQLPRNPRSFLLPVLDLNSPPSKKDSLFILKNCGSDNTCIPNLELTAHPSVEEYFLDSGEKFYLDIYVTNTGEDAFESTFEVKYPDGLFYVTSVDVEKEQQHVLCSSGENNTIKCEIGNPIPQDAFVHFELYWQPDYSKELPSKLFFDMSVNSTNEERVETRGNNKRRIGVSIFYDIIQEIRGWSAPAEVIFKPTTTSYVADISNQTHRTSAQDRLSEEVIGPQVIHMYELKNAGKTTIKATEIFFVWPATTNSGEDFLYLVDPPHFSFTRNLNLKCGPIPANYRDFEVPARKKSIWDLYFKDVITETTNDKIVSSKDSHIGSTIGGKIVEGNKIIDDAVANTGDSSKVMDVRQQNGATRVQIFQTGDSNQLSEGFRHLQVSGRDYVYRCLKTIDGREEEVDCGENFSFSGVNIPSLLQHGNAIYQEEGDIRYSCLETDSTGNWRKVECGDVPKIRFRQEQKITVQVFPGGQELAQKLVSGKYQQQQIAGRNFTYRCFRKNNGREEEIDCGNRLSLSQTDVSTLLRQGGYQDGNIRYTCLESDSSGNLRSTNCQNLPKIRLKTKIQTFSWGSNDTHYWNDTGVYQRPDAVTIQLFPGGEELKQRLEGRNFQQKQIEGKDYIYRCFRRVNGKEEEINCGENFSFSSVDIPWLLEKSGVPQGDIRYTCLQPDENGNLNTRNCVNVPKVQFKQYSWGSNNTHSWNNSGTYTTVPRTSISTVQIFPGSQSLRQQLEGGLYHQLQINGRDYIYRCFKRVQGREEEVNCDNNLSFSNLNIPWLLEQSGLREGNIRYTCLVPDSFGNLKNGQCGLIPKIRLQVQTVRKYWQSNGTHYWNDTGVFRTTERYDFTVVQIFEGGQDAASQFVGKYRFETIDSRHYFYRCFQNLEPMDCGTRFTLAAVNFLELLRRASFRYEGSIRYFCIEMGADGYWRDTDCGRLPRIQTHEAQKTVVHQSSQILRRCLKLVSNKWQEVDCSSDARFQTGDGTFIEECFQTVNGQRARIPCDQIQGTINSFSSGTQTYNSGRNNQQTGGGYGNYDGNQSYEYEESGEYVYPDNEETQRLAEARNKIQDAGPGRGFTAATLDLGTLNQGSNAQTHWSDTRHVAPVYNNLERDNVPTQSPSSRNWHHGRRKRQIIGDSHPSIGEVKKKYPCKNLDCVYMRCTIENLEHDKPLTIALRGRLNAKVLRETNLDNGLEFSSMMIARVHKLPHLMNLDNSKLVVQEAKTVVKTPEEIKSETVPLWVVVLSAVAGTIILLLLIFLMYKFGFFRRNRPYSAPERQPLRNGYPHDEAL